MPKGVYIRTELHNKAMSRVKQGTILPPRSVTHRQALSKANTGQSPWSKGKHLSTEHRKNIAVAHTGKIQAPHSVVARFKMRRARVAYMKLHGNQYQSSVSATTFLNKIETEFGVVILREYELGGRFFDGKYADNLLEIDCEYWHSRPKMKRVDVLKNKIATKHKFKLHRFIVNSVQEVDARFQQYYSQLFQLFGNSVEHT